MVRSLLGQAGSDVKRPDAVIEGGIFLGRGISLPLFGQHMQENRAVELGYILKGFDKQVDVVAVNGADVSEFQGLKKHTRGEEADQGVLAFFQDRKDIVSDGRDGTKKGLQVFFEVDEPRFRDLAA